MKKLTKYIFFSLVFTLAVFLVPGVTANADEETIAAGQDITVRSEEKDQDKKFVFTAPADGYCSVLYYQKQFRYRNSMGIKYDDGRGLYSDRAMYNHTDDFAVTAGAKYHLTVSPVNGYDYVLRWNFTPADNWEKENNDTAETATKISAGKVYNGSLTYTGYSPYDTVDYFSFTIDKDSIVNFRLAPRDKTKSPNYTLDLINTDSESYTLGRELKTALKSSVYLKKGTYYLKLTGGNPVYELSYTAKTITAKKNTSVSKLSGYSYKNYNTRYAHIDYLDLNNALNNIAGYRVKIAKNKKMKGLLMDENIEITYPDTVHLARDLNYKKQKVYVTVQPYFEDPFGHEIWGRKSKVKEVKLSKK